ncbi:N-acetylmuramoyl-L-alanine amidase [Pelosinus sp. IPA-1]|uniref:N-acetylmuramoyl-L-alanine amidase family protein n=1 Tax=Pelosinus sp. IPA-1 TaxID=3029569 RepID=UPI0025561839|nr:N-acetylmuramoyl-L-alanine amidase [Pelosinus sp. IPA-1]
MLYLGKRHFILFLLPVMLLLSTLYANDATHKLSGKVIVVDAGHGGIDPGANRPGVLEKDINLSIALALKDVLNQNGAKVALSRQTDVELSPECDNEKVRGRYHRDLAARVEMAEESDADLFMKTFTNKIKRSLIAY